MNLLFALLKVGKEREGEERKERKKEMGGEGNKSTSFLKTCMIRMIRI